MVDNLLSEKKDDNHLSMFNLERRVFYSPRQKSPAAFQMNEQNLSGFSQFKNTLAALKLRFNQKFNMGGNKILSVHTDSESTTGGQMKSYNTQKGYMMSIHDRILSEMYEEDLNNSNDTAVRRGRQLFISVDISALTAGFKEGDFVE